MQQKQNWQAWTLNRLNFTLYHNWALHVFHEGGRTWKLHPVTCWTVVIFDSPRCSKLAINTPAGHPRPPGTSSPRLASFSLTLRINLLVHSAPDLIWCVLKGCHVAVCVLCKQTPGLVFRLDLVEEKKKKSNRNRLPQSRMHPQLYRSKRHVFTSGMMLKSFSL